MTIEKYGKATVITHFSKSRWLLLMEMQYGLKCQTVRLPDWQECRKVEKYGCYAHQQYMNTP
jgi:hypothetical protein